MLKCCEHVQVAGGAEGTKTEPSASAASPAKVTETKVSDLLRADDPRYVGFSMISSALHHGGQDLNGLSLRDTIAMQESR